MMSRWKGVRWALAAHQTLPVDGPPIELVQLKGVWDIQDTLDFAVDQSVGTTVDRDMQSYFEYEEQE